MTGFTEQRPGKAFIELKVDIVIHILVIFIYCHGYGVFTRAVISLSNVNCSAPGMVYYGFAVLIRFHAFKACVCYYQIPAAEFTLTDTAYLLYIIIL
jgi:hypothetical protein